MQNSPPGDQELEKKLLFTILEYLQSLTREENNLGLDRESLQVAIDCLSSAVKMNISDPQQRQLYSIGNVNLPHIFSLGLARAEQLELALKQLRQQRENVREHAASSSPAVSSSSPTSSPTSATTSHSTTPSSDEDARFQAYLRFLKSRGYFEGLTEGSPEWQERYTFAKQRYYAKHPPSSSAPPTSPTPTTSLPSNTNVSAPSSSVTPATASTPKPTSEEQTQQAEKYKTEGNDKMQAKKYEEAIQCYTKAIELAPNNPIYYGNRAAAYSHMGRHLQAIEDCKKAIALDPKYVKAYSRLGLAYFSMGKYREAVESYRKALELDPTNTAIRDSLGAAEIKLREFVSPSQQTFQNPPSGNRPPNVPPEIPNIQEVLNTINNPAFQQMFRGMTQGLMGQSRPHNVTGMPGAGNMESLLNNPQFANMLSNPELLSAITQQLLNNPAIVNMAAQLMQNPTLVNAMNNLFMGSSLTEQGHIPQTSPQSGPVSAPTPNPTSTSAPLSPITSTSAPTSTTTSASTTTPTTTPISTSAPKSNSNPSLPPTSEKG
jgi:small glutamine-rich tetratricopeptide repeat-containing protein alpha